MVWRDQGAPALRSWVHRGKLSAEQERGAKTAAPLCNFVWSHGDGKRRGEVGSYFGNHRAHGHNCRSQAANSEGEGLADKLTKIWDSFLIKIRDRGHSVWPFGSIKVYFREVITCLG